MWILFYGFLVYFRYKYLHKIPNYILNYYTFQNLAIPVLPISFFLKLVQAAH